MNHIAKTKNSKNTRSNVNQWDLPDEFLLNGESLTGKTSIIEKYENTKTVKLDRTHQEDLSEISQLLTQTLLMIYLQPTPHLSSMIPFITTSMQQPVSQSPRINQPSGHHMNCINKRTMNTKTKTVTKLAKKVSTFYPVFVFHKIQNQDKDLIVQFHPQ